MSYWNAFAGMLLLALLITGIGYNSAQNAGDQPQVTLAEKLEMLDGIRLTSFQP